MAKHLQKNYAIIQTMGKQLFIKSNYWYNMDFQKSIKNGDYILFHKILFLKKAFKAQVGQPFLDGCNLLGVVIQQVSGKKITILKTKPKKNYTRTQGHKPKFTRIFIKKTEEKETYGA